MSDHQPTYGPQGQSGYGYQGQSGYGSQGQSGYGYQGPANTPGGPSYPDGPGDPMYPQGPGGPSGGGSGHGKGLFWTLIAVGVLVVVAVIALILLLVRGGEAAADDDTTQPQDSAAAEAPAVDAESPAAAVESYFTALADGEAEAARSLLYEVSDDSLMTEEVLAASLELAPITDVEVTEDAAAEEAAYSQEVQVSYTLGEVGVTKRVYTYQNPDTDAWEVDAEAELMQPDLGDLAVTVNGEAVEGGEATVFLGLMYQLDLEEENFSFDGDGVVEVTETYTTATTLEVALTEAATETWRELIIADVEDCIASKEMEAGCGLDMPADVSGAAVVEGSISRSLPAETDQALQRLTPSPSYTTPTLVKAEYFTGQVNVEYEAEEGGVTSLYELYFGDPGTLGTPLVDMTADEPEVIWE
ncbi:hypothetical protein [Nesterenkonia lutea]|uniref:DUF4878 domain-containing protein n=1 Tax=Nesterenkonia lutea TaxID=272919 RepID=A0ABR9JGX5_9MICC|nr:hypothetical protein [Nesterenkonia lutea]MBE1525028.1 hypothetical protein [Nesterenkonia lutea]